VDLPVRRGKCPDPPVRASSTALGQPRKLSEPNLPVSADDPHRAFRNLEIRGCGLEGIGRELLLTIAVSWSVMSARKSRRRLTLSRWPAAVDTRRDSEGALVDEPDQQLKRSLGRGWGSRVRRPLSSGHKIVKL
jgi:hypothetical protein